MAVQSSVDGKSSINVKGLTMWKVTSDGASGISYDATAYTFPDELNSAKTTPKVQTASQYGDGKKCEDYVAKDGGDVEIVIRGFKPGDEEYLFGETKKENGVSVSNSGDIVPYVCVAYVIELPDGTVTLVKLPKVKFMPQGSDNKQREGSAISYSTATLRGTYSPTLYNGDDKYTAIGVEDGGALMTAWLAKAEAIAAET